MNKKKQRRTKNEGSITKKSNGKYSAYVNLGIDENGKRIRKYFTTNTKEEAEQEISRLTGKLTSLKIESFKNTACDFMKEWLMVFRINEVTSRTFENDIRNFKIHIKPYFESLNLVDIDTTIIKKLFNKIYAKNHSQDVQRKVRTLLKQFFDYAVEEKLIQYNPVLSVRKIKQEKIDFTIDDIEKYNKSIKVEDRKTYLTLLKQKPFLYSLCAVGYYTGLRIGEILALKWSDFDLEKGTMSIDKGLTYDVKYDNDGNVIERKNIISTPKTTASIAILPLPDKLKNVLIDWKSHQEKIEIKYKTKLTEFANYIFCKKDGCIRSYHGTKSIYYKFLEKNKLSTKEFHFHALRHTFGTILRDNDENLINIQMLLRHKSAKTTERYLSMNTKKVLSFKSKLDSIFEKEDQESNK